jgi:hypothetical protein
MPAALVIGARGVLGGLIADAFERAGWDVRRGVRRAPAAASERLVDLDRPDTIAPALEGADVVVSAAPHPELPAERLVLARGGTLLSVVAMSAEEERPLRELAAHARGTVVPNAGILPGVTNLLAAELLRAHPQADGLELVMIASASGTRGRAGGEFCYEQLRTRRRHRTTVVPLPAPLGPTRCIEFGEGCDGWLGTLAEGRDAHAYLCFPERPQRAGLLAANALGACRLLPRAPFVAERPAGPEGASRHPVAEWVAATRGGERLAASSVECEGDYRATAAIAVAFAEHALARELPPGCHDPHELLALAELAPRLAQDGIRVVAQDVGRARHR